MSYSGEKKNITQTSDEAREFHAEASRLHVKRVESGLPRNSQGFLAWAPVLVTGPVRPEDGPMKSGIQTYIDDGRAGGAGVQEQSQSETSTPGNKDKRPTTPARRKYVSIPWAPSSKKGKKRVLGPSDDACAHYGSLKSGPAGLDC